MTSPFSFVLSLKELFAGKLQQFMSDIDDVHSVWLTEIKQEADRMLTSDFSAEPELMPKTPSQKRNNRRKRVSLGYQEETRAKRRFSKGKRSKLRGSSVKTLDLLAEDEGIPRASTSGQVVELPKRSTRRNKQTVAEASLEEAAFSECSAEQVPEVGPEVAEQVPEVGPDVADQELKTAVAEEKSEVIDMELEKAVPDAETEIEEETELEADEPQVCSSIHTPSPPEIPATTVSVRISSTDRRSAELVAQRVVSPGRSATKIVIADTPSRARRISNVRLSLKLRYSKAGLRQSRMQDGVRRTSRRSILKKKLTRGGNTTCSSNDSDDSCIEIDGEVEKDRELPSVQSDDAETAADEPQAIPDKAGSGNERVTRSMAVNSPVLLFSPVLSSMLRGVPSVLSPGGAKTTPVGSWRGSRNSKRKSPEAKEATPNKKPLPAKKSQSVMRPNMRAFLQTVQKNQMLMMTPASMGRSTVMKSFIKHTTPLKVDAKAKERLKLEALKKKQEQEEERIKKMEEEKRRKLDEQKRKRDERLRRVVEARMKEDEEKKKRIEQKMSQTDEKNDKMRVERVAEEKAKKKVAVKRQEELEQKKRVEEEARLKKIQQAEEEKRQQELVAKRAEEEERARKLAEARRALELRREREKEQEQEKERRALAERERAEREKALATLWANREKERKEMEEKRNLEEKRRREEHQRLAAENAAREAAMHKMAAASAALNVKSSLLNSPVRKGAALNITVEVEKSPQSYSLTPKGGNKPLLKSNSAEDYGMDQKSDDSTDDESAPRKPIPSWAEGHNLQQAITKQYFNPPDLHTYFGVCEPPKLEDIFYKSKPRYFKRTSSAVWHSPPRHGNY
ncbi:inner centromere protein isoform X2 [Gadus chalcogrammus]|uniref:inner centromere protein isoform X2 n=1 Tax=Gadus chalcogrammus TaxID=1042646 RepID=UPI0024C4B48F|nr:inner centromere protein isoform X2 [Gadus chalcogrammus]